MGSARRVLYLLNVAYLILLAGSACQNNYLSCDAWASYGECEINTYMMCFCSQACSTPSECRENNTDTSCHCARKAAQGLCEHGTAKDICPYTCQLRQNVSCGQPEQYTSAVATGNWTYMSRVTYTCRKGYTNNGGVGLRICSERGEWITTGSVPDCVPDLSNNTQCLNLISAFQFVKKSTVDKVSILNSNSGGNVLDCADSCLRLHGCTHFAYKKGICDIYYNTEHAGLVPRNGKLRKKIYHLL